MRVTMQHLKGSVRQKSIELSFEPVQSLGVLKNPFYGEIDIDPTNIFRLLKERSGGKFLSNVRASSFQRTLDHLLERAGIPNFSLDRNRKPWTHHSTRVTGCCMLLRCGADAAMVSAIAGWESDMVSHYGRKILLSPNLVEPVKFYNPYSMRGKYGGRPDGGTM